MGVDQSRPLPQVKRKKFKRQTTTATPDYDNYFIRHPQSISDRQRSLCVDSIQPRSNSDRIPVRPERLPPPCPENDSVFEDSYSHPHSTTLHSGKQHQIKPGPRLISSKNTSYRVSGVELKQKYPRPKRYVCISTGQLNDPPYIENETIIDTWTKDSIYLALEDTHPEWLAVISLSTQIIGLIPRYALRLAANNLEKQDYFFGRCNRLEAYRLIFEDIQKEGTFLLRLNDEDQYCISAIHKGEIKDWLIEYENQFYKIKGSNQALPSLETLIQYHKSSGLLREACQNIHDAHPQPHGNYEIDAMDLRFLSEVGKGNFGKVTRMEYTMGVINGSSIKQEVAAKILFASSSDFAKEISVMKRLRHKNLVTLFGVSSLPEGEALIMEYLPDGSLYELVKRHMKNGETAHLDIYKSLRHLSSLGSQICSGMAHMEKLGVVHRDLRTANILVKMHRTQKRLEKVLKTISNIDLTVKEKWLAISELIRTPLDIRVADFGLSIDSSIEPNNEKLPLRWMAPEVLNRQKYTSKSDVWSFGILILEVLTDCIHPYSDLRWGKDFYEKVRSGYTYPLNVSDFFHSSHNQDGHELLFKIIRDCWQYDPWKRKSFSELQQIFINLLSAGEKLDIIRYMEQYTLQSNEDSSEEDVQESMYETPSSVSSDRK